ncbi:LysR family transcriptional regulator [Bradyrhizobium sp. NAS96.2]|uniref:LysR family transcriptional regulator n=1 Tax=Bradyrhizobium sp. NAS96.2 TaxID=1680160 RepID=UPI00093D386F|nr:LysR family transcriptional regulator [Bradyrhizobium sp. NAS96.2]OKO84213.1 LysR family transcriptional regulator [Bradyrhizobium sp. NAS96.2]
MNLRSIDLNLLVALDALLTERHVTKAADRVGLSQPAMSNALNRLRAMFEDELLVRTTAGMKPTPRATELAEPLRQVLRQVERVMASDTGFDPTRTERSFTIRMSDILACLLLPRLAAARSPDARISYNIIHLPPALTIDALERDEIDVAVSMGLEHSASIRSETLLRDRMVCLMRSGHPIKRGKLTFERFIAQEHMKVSISPTDLRFVDDVLAERGHRRRITLNVPHWLVVPHVLKSTDLLAVMPRHLAAVLMDDGLRMEDLPFESAPFDWMLYWHRRYDQSNANGWLRDRLRAACSGLS